MGSAPEAGVVSRSKRPMPEQSRKDEVFVVASLGVGIFMGMQVKL
jgi:hypothetical protein